MQNSSDFINKSNTYSVIGASTNPEKYGHRVFLDLSGAGYQVYGVNKNGGEINGSSLFTSLGELYKSGVTVDVAIFVIPADAGLEVLNDIVGLGIKKVWLQPGAERDDLIELLKRNDIEVIYGACIMVERAGAIK